MSYQQTILGEVARMWLAGLGLTPSEHVQWGVLIAEYYPTGLSGFIADVGY